MTKLTEAEEMREMMQNVHEEEGMGIAGALEIVLELAQQNVADQLDNPEHHREQEVAIALVYDMASKQFGIGQ